MLVVMASKAQEKLNPGIQSPVASLRGVERNRMDSNPLGADSTIEKMPKTSVVMRRKLGTNIRIT